jgi:hypothetical protein
MFIFLLAGDETSVDGGRRGEKQPTRAFYAMSIVARYGRVLMLLEGW